MSIYFSQWVREQDVKVEAMCFSQADVGIFHGQKHRNSTDLNETVSRLIQFKGKHANLGDPGFVKVNRSLLC